MIVLGIETTCDETAIAIVENGKKILANCIASQADMHAEYGGVFPEIASRAHVDLLLPLVEKAFAIADLSPSDIDLIAVAHTPGLLGSLLIGVSAAQALSFCWNKPIMGINHVEAHLYSALMAKDAKEFFPALGIVLSGGHTFLAKMDDPIHYTLLGTTVDDAIGEAFDKVATLLDLPYPGGIAIESLAQKGDPGRYPFQAGQVKKKPLSFSFSGLKTNVFYTVKGGQARKKSPPPLHSRDKQDLAASFQQVAFSDVITKAKRAFVDFPYQAIYFGGGVTANQTLRSLFKRANFPCPLYWPSMQLTGDNGAMIAGLAFQWHSRGISSPVCPSPRIKKKIVLS